MAKYVCRALPSFQEEEEVFLSLARDQIRSTLLKEEFDRHFQNIYKKGVDAQSMSN
jgi:hypothetical protein